MARFLVTPLAVAVCWVSLGAAPSQAGLVTTEEVVTEEVAATDRARVKAYLARQDVQSQLQKLGIKAEEATARVDGLTDAEVQRIAAKLDERSAGSGVVGSVVGAAVFVFIVLLITDIAGATDVFPFVKK
ncbi:MAG: PA2779 family protein [Thiohalorhabdaceae bacterium]